MKKIIIQFSFISLFFRTGISHCFAQNTIYHPFPTGYAFWVDAQGGFSPPFDNVVYIVMNGDTQLNGLTYQKIYTTPYDTDYLPYLTYFIREDSDKKIMMYRGNSSNPELIIYDFNLEESDSFCVTCFGFAIDTCFWSHVTQIDTIQTLIDSRTRYKIESAHPNFPLWGYQDNNNYWIEGIGSTLGLGGYLYCPYNVPDETPYAQLLCFWNNGQYILESPYGCFFTGVADVNSEKFIFSVSPNPVIDRVNIISPAFLSETLFISIVSMAGNSIFSKEGVNQLMNNINIGNLPTGFYLVKITDEQNRPVFTAPFVKQ